MPQNRKSRRAAKAGARNPRSTARPAPRRLPDRQAARPAPKQRGEAPGGLRKPASHRAAKLRAAFGADREAPKLSAARIPWLTEGKKPI